MDSKEANQTPEVLKHLYALIGSIASTWSHLEQSVDVTLWSLAGLDSQLGACLTAQIQSLAYRLNALVAIVQLKGGSKELIKSINQFCAEADRLTRDRNRVVHDPISSIEGEEPTAITITARKTLKYGFFGGKTEEYTQINTAIGQLLARYIKLDDEIRDNLKRTIPSPQR
nr:hypothetical protein [uncultured Rhodopila sp.]